MGRPSSILAAGPRIILLPGGTIQQKLTLSNDAKINLKAVLVEVKARLLPGSQVSDAELTQWINMIYADGWQPGQFCEGGDEKSTTRTSRNSTVTIGTLIQSLRASPKSLGRGRTRSFSERRTHQNTAPHAEQWWRRAGAPFRLLVGHKQDGVINFST